MNPRPTTDEAAGREPLPPTVLHGHRLFFARAACVALTALTVGLFVASLPAAHEQLRTVCEGHAGCVYPRLFPEDAKALEGSGLSVGFYVAYHVALALALALGFWVIGAILFWKGSGHRVALFASAALVTCGTVYADTLHWLADAYPRLDLPVDLVYFVGGASFFVLFCVFPDGRFVPRWTRWAAVVWITYWLLRSFFPPDSPVNPGTWPLVIEASLFLGLIGSLVGAQIYRYRRVSEPVERQQTKWVVFSFTVWIVMVVVVLLIDRIFALTQPGIPLVFYDLVSPAVIVPFQLLIPMSIGFAILRYRLWDIDLIIRRSLVIGPLATILTVVFELANQLLLPFLFRFIPGMEDSSTINTVASVVIVVVLVKPLHARLNAGVNRLVDRLVGGDGKRASPGRDEDTFISPPSSQ
jgi:hypothetical protein